MSNVVDLLTRPVYSLPQVDRVLGLHVGTSRRWIEYAPVLLREMLRQDLNRIRRTGHATKRGDSSERAGSNLEQSFLARRGRADAGMFSASKVAASLHPLRADRAARHAASGVRSLRLAF
jgi:hypothetical protein